MTLPDKDHPVWKILQNLLTILILLLVAKHAISLDHTNGLDVTDIIGMIAGGKLGSSLLQLKAGTNG